MLVVVAVGGIWVSDARAAISYSLEPTLSLTGSCTPTEGDPVEDPGCPAGNHPPKRFTSPRSIVTDFYGDIYVASYGKESANGAEGRIDIFDRQGFYIGEVADPVGPKDLAIDSKGNLYVFDANPKAGGRLVRFSPTEYIPEEGKIEYGKPPVVVTEAESLFLQSIAVNPVSGHVFLYVGSQIEQFGSAEEGNKFLETIAGGALAKSNGQGLAVDAAHGLLYADDKEAIKVFELAPPHKLIRTITGSATSLGKYTTFASVAADEKTGDFFVLDGEKSKSIYHYSESGEFLATVKAELLPIFGSEVYVDNGPLSPNSGFNSLAEAGYLFAPNEESGVGISYALAPDIKLPPEVKAISFANVTQEDAELRATINPGGIETTYTFEYTTRESFEAEGFAGASIAGEGQIPAGLSGVPVSASATGLAPETEYRFRVVATNSEGPDEAEDSFATYPEEEAIQPCPNDATRTGLSALLPDCRAYELVTPPDTNARAPRGIGKTAGVYFPTREASPAGEKVSFITEGGAIPGDEGTGSLSGDAYLSTRSATGWSTASAGPTGVESVAPLTGSTSPDQGYSFWESSPTGSAAVEGKVATYLRYPDGHSALVGRGSLAVDPRTEGRLISENGSHSIFRSNVHLEPNAPPSGTQAVYDRTIDQTTGEEETHVVSLLPGNVTPVAGQNATYEGASLDGKGVAFKIGEKLYLRFNDEETYEIGENVTFAGVAEGGARIFYLKGGDLFAFDAESEETIRFTESGDVTPVNVAAEGTAAYFVSPSVLTGEEENPDGGTAQKGEENLYLSREGAISFVATVTERDVEGEFGITEQAEGLGLWTTAVGATGSGPGGRLAIDPSRTTPDGGVMLFESRAALAGYDPEGHAEIYRYDATGEELECLSCNPTQAPATSDASLQSILQEKGKPEPFNSYVLVENLRAEGNRAFFQSSEPLVQNDTDELQDVYEWEADEVGTCKRPEGCIFLISSGQSHRTDYLYGVSNSGDNVFFRTSDLLLPSDADETPSIYDARVDGGFPEPDEEICHGEGCRPTITPPPVISHSESGIQGPEPEPAIKKCPKGKHKVTKNGKTRCVKNKKHHKHHRAGSKRKGATR